MDHQQSKAFETRKEMIGSTNIEQAVYTSARTTRGEGYHLVARSPGISDADVRALSTWSPSHDGLLPDVPEKRSINFFALPSGLFCISRSMIDGEDYSQRGAPRLVTNLLVVEPDVMARFSYDPFALLRAVELSGRLATGDTAGNSHLAPIALVGRSKAVNQSQLGDLLAEIGAARIGIAIESLLACRPLAIRASVSTEKLIAGIWKCLPIECRGEFSFSTGLQYSPRRPFDLLALPSDPQSQRRMTQRYDLNTVDLGNVPGLKLTIGGWANHVAMTLACKGVTTLANQLSTLRPGLTLADLPALAEELAQNTLYAQASDGEEFTEEDADTDSPMRMAHAHGAHRRHQQKQPAVSSTALKGGSLSLAVSNALLEKLDALDDAVFAAIAGEEGSLERLQTLWPAVIAEVPPEFVEESQEHYLGHALRIWEHFVQEGRSPERAIAALDVLTLICGENRH
jgi:hypothetical protein